MTWADAGDTVEPGAAAGSRYLWHRGSTRLHRDHLTDLVTFDGGYPTGVAVNDVIVIDDGGPFQRSYTVTMVDNDHEELETSNDDGGTGSESVQGWVVYKPGRRLEGYQLRTTGFQITTWQLYSDGSYYGEDGTPEAPVPFVCEIVDAGSNGSVQVVDVYGNEHTWSSGSAGDYWPNKTTPSLLQEVKARHDGNELPRPFPIIAHGRLPRPDASRFPQRAIRSRRRAGRLPDHRTFGRISVTWDNDGSGVATPTGGQNLRGFLTVGQIFRFNGSTSP